MRNSSIDFGSLSVCEFCLRFLCLNCVSMRFHSVNFFISHVTLSEGLETADSHAVETITRGIIENRYL